MKSGLGCGAFFAGVVVVVLALAPSLTRDWVGERIERQFGELHEGRLELEDVELSWTDPQRAVATLRGVDGEPIVSGRLRAPSLFHLMGADVEDARNAELPWVFQAEQAVIVADPEGRTNLGRALELTGSGRLERDRARRAGAPFGAEWGAGERPLRITVEVERVLRSDAGGAPVLAARDLAVRALFAPRRAAEVDVRAQLVASAPEGGEPAVESGRSEPREFRMRAAFPSARWWRGEDVPFDFELHADGLSRGWIPVGWIPAAWRSASELLGETLSIDLVAERGANAEATFELSRLETGTIELSASGECVAPGLTQPFTYDGGPPLRVLQIDGLCSGLPLEVLFGFLLRDPGLGLTEPQSFSITATSNGAVQGPGGHWPLWVLAFDVEDLRLPGPGAFAATARAGEPRATLSAGAWSLGDVGVKISGSAPDAPLAIGLVGAGVEFDLSLPQIGRAAGPGNALRGGRGRLALGPGQPLPMAWLAACVPFLAELRPTEQGLVVEATDLTLPADGDPRRLRGSFELNLAGAALRLGGALGPVLGTPSPELAVSAPGLVHFELADGVAHYRELQLEGGEDLILRVGGEWDHGGDELELHVTAPIAALSPGAVAFLDENRDMIGPGVEIPLVLTGPVRAPVIEVDASFRADVLEGVLGTMRGLTDYFGERVGQPLGKETLELLDQLGGLLRERE